MRRLDLSILAIVLVALAAWPAPADEPRPELTELRVGAQVTDVVARGEHLEAWGERLHACPQAAPGQPQPPCAHRGLVVRLGGKTALVLAADAEHVMFRVGDDVPLGPTRVEVVIDGVSAGTLTVRVVEPGQAPPRGQHELPGAAPVQPGAPAPDSIRAGFEVTRFDVLRDASGTRFVVEGRAEDVPDGMSMTVSLEFAGDPVGEVQSATISGGRYRTTFGPFSRPLPLGGWRTSALFALPRQPRRLVREWRKRLLPAQLEDLDRVERVLEAQVGTPDEVAAQRQAMEARYRDVARGTTALLDDALAAYASACRVLFRDPATNTYRRPQHLAHARSVGAARTPEEAARVDADLRFATAAGHLKADELQAWVEGSFLPAWLDSYSADGAYREATAFPIEPGAAVLATRLHAILLATLQTHSRALFEAERLPVPASLEAPPSGVSLPPLEATELGRRAFERRREELLRRLGGP